MAFANMLFGVIVGECCIATPCYSVSTPKHISHGLPQNGQ